MIYVLAAIIGLGPAIAFLFLYPILVVAGGAFVGWIAGWAMPETFAAWQAWAGLGTLQPWQVGAGIGFIGSFFRAHLTVNTTSAPKKN